MISGRKREEDREISEIKRSSSSIEVRFLLDLAVLFVPLENSRHFGTMFGDRALELRDGGVEIGGRNWPEERGSMVLLVDTESSEL